MPIARRQIRAVHAAMLTPHLPLFAHRREA
jgi:hypothetical protein